MRGEDCKEAQKNALTLLNRLANRLPEQVILLRKAFWGRLDDLTAMARDAIRKMVEDLEQESYRNSVLLREVGLAATHTIELISGEVALCYAVPANTPSEGHP